MRLFGARTFWHRQQSAAAVEDTMRPLSRGSQCDAKVQADGVNIMKLCVSLNGVEASVEAIKHKICMVKITIFQYLCYLHIIRYY